MSFSKSVVIKTVKVETGSDLFTWMANILMCVCLKSLGSGAMYDESGHYTTVVANFTTLKNYDPNVTTVWRKLNFIHIENNAVGENLNLHLLGNPKSILPFDKTSNNSVLLYCLKILRS